MENTAQPLDSVSESLKKITYGYYILTTRKDSLELTTRAEDYVAAGTVCWVSQVSFEPKMVMVAVEKDSDLNETIQKSQVFALNVLGQKNQPLIERFSRKTDVQDEAHQLNGYRFEDGETGAPLLTDTVASLECRLVDAITLKGDHMIFIGEVVNAVVRDAEEPLLTDQEAGYKYGG
ncbi:MAG: flavin reductase family protein [Ferruginibacter sp.]|nr:flavin reductase family protein [Cytophagales bacterium]